MARCLVCESVCVCVHVQVLDHGYDHKACHDTEAWSWAPEIFLQEYKRQLTKMRHERTNSMKPYITWLQEQAV